MGIRNTTPRMDNRMDNCSDSVTKKTCACRDSTGFALGVPKN